MASARLRWKSQKCAHSSLFYPWNALVKSLVCSHKRDMILFCSRQYELSTTILVDDLNALKSKNYQLTALKKCNNNALKKFPLGFDRNNFFRERCKRFSYHEKWIYDSFYTWKSQMNFKLKYNEKKLIRRVGYYTNYSKHTFLFLILFLVFPVIST